MENYLKYEEFDDEINSLEKFGKVQKETGKFVFDKCSICQGPNLGHKDLQNCKNEILSACDIEKIELYSTSTT